MQVYIQAVGPCTAERRMEISFQEEIFPVLKDFFKTKPKLHNKTKYPLIRTLKLMVFLMINKYQNIQSTELTVSLTIENTVS